ncbi:MAG: [protein-PII] uridylyltransferase [Candidatus Nitricoxidivorans perseverans]|uniref:Bifunctional uridylyltransferase/uridylyl-removing enzyme n=1 Tax=Candidatus Nitricoxidivorans perseverans TaxID=2975601 RepID=A0AA49FLM2_9PROT|nr:MAG: [protein-PII] uridylyltransferase [Candidatus Nitricoxidivorans perseverans]
MPAAAIARTGSRTLIAETRAALHAGQTELRAAYEQGGNAGALLRGRARLVDRALRGLWQKQDVPADIALVAVGGYGRGELYPASDIDLLLLVPEGCDAAHHPRIESLVGLLWDIGLDIGHSVRSVGECLVESDRDITVQTTLIEARLLRGNRGLFAEFVRRFQEHLDPVAFFKAKLLEQEERHARHNDTPYSLEPNCKESPGGLRDLQMIRWLALAANLDAPGAHWRDLADAVLVTAEEARSLGRAEEFLRHIRIRMHHLAGRREDKLLFEYQEKLAQSFSIQPTELRRASEILMQRYYRNAKLVTQLNSIVLLNLGDRIAPGPAAAPVAIDERFQTVSDRLDIRDDGVFERTPRAILECFLLMERRSELKGMTARTLRALWQARDRIDAAFRRDPDNRALFLSLFRQERGLVHELRLMNRYGILGRYLPAFRRIVGQMQHDLFHAYTVDQHILQVVRNLRRFSMAEFAHEYPFCTQLMADFERSWLLYVAALFHDIAKGRGGDHSRLGMADARRFCREHGIAGEDGELVVFLVEHHLTMSSVAQKQDLADPDVIDAFAKVVRNERRLTALFLITVADIRGTGPKVWNAWKGKLLEDLYHLTLQQLRGDAPLPMVGLAQRQWDAKSLLRLRGLSEGVEADLWKQLDTGYFMRHDAGEIAWHTRMLYYRVDSAEPVVKARLNPIGEGLQVMVYIADQPGLFARLCGFFARLGYSIAEARIHTTRHGYALDSFALLDPGHDMPYRDMIALVEHDLTERLRAPSAPEAPVSVRLSRQVRHFPITPTVNIHVDDRGNQYVMSISAADRPGLLHAVARVLSQHGVQIRSAKIATLGERVEDTFLISGHELSRMATLVRLEQELLAVLQI